jgi:hypothetical protein
MLASALTTRLCPLRSVHLSSKTHSAHTLQRFSPKHFLAHRRASFTFPLCYAYCRHAAKLKMLCINETPTPKDLAEDLTQGESEFDAAIQRDPGFVDAKLGAASCVINRLFLEGVFPNEKDPTRFREILAPASLLLKEAAAAAPDNPRLLWVIGPNQWSTPLDRGAAKTKPWQPTRRAWKQHGHKKVAPVTPWNPLGESLSC